MSVAYEIERIKTNIANAYATAETMGATMPETQNSENLSATIGTITGGASSTVSKGLIIDEVDDDGFVIAAHIEGMENIPSYFFYGMSSNSNNYLGKALITMSDEVLTLEANAMSNNPGLRGGLVLSNNLISIGNAALNNVGVKELVIPDSVQSMTGISVCGSMTQLEKITFSAGLTELPLYVCEGDSKLKQVHIKGNISTIPDRAFNYCIVDRLVLSGITQVPTLSSAKSLPTTGFENPISEYPGVYVPDDLLDAFINDAGWQSYNDLGVLLPLSELPEEYYM